MYYIYIQKYIHLYVLFIYNLAVLGLSCSTQDLFN